MGAGCCRQDASGVASPNQNDRNNNGMMRNGNNNNNNYDSDIRLTSIVSNNNTHQLGTHSPRNEMDGSAGTIINTASTTNLTISAGQPGTARGPDLLAHNHNNNNNDPLNSSYDDNNNAIDKSFLAKEQFLSSSMKAILKIAQPCSMYFRGMEGIFYCVGDEDCPVLSANPSEEIWGGSAPSKSMISACEKELTYLLKTDKERKERQQDDDSHSQRDPSLSASGKKQDGSAVKSDDKDKNSKSTKGSATTTMKLEDVMKKSENTNEEACTTFEEAQECLSPREAVAKKEATTTRENHNDDDDSSSNHPPHVSTSSSDISPPPSPSCSLKHQAFVTAKRTLPDAKKSAIYTADSSCCRCARHAGIIGKTGGVFIVVSRPGQQQYEGLVSPQSGLPSHNHGEYDLSIEVLPMKEEKK